MGINVYETGACWKCCQEPPVSFDKDKGHYIERESPFGISIRHIKFPLE